MLEEAVPDLCEDHLSSCTLEELAPKSCLEIEELLAQGRLRYPELLGSARHGPALDDPLDEAEVPYLEAAHFGTALYCRVASSLSDRFHLWR